MENQLAPLDFFFFYCISPLKYLNLVLIPGAKLDGHRGTWTGCLILKKRYNLCRIKLEPVRWTSLVMLSWSSSDNLRAVHFSNNCKYFSRPISILVSLGNLGLLPNYIYDNYKLSTLLFGKKLCVENIEVFI